MRRIRLALVLVVGWTAFGTADVVRGDWNETSSLRESRYNHTATLLQSGKVLVAGGENGDPELVSGNELYNPAAGTWTPTGALLTPRVWHTATLLPSGKVLVVGGRDREETLADTEIYDPATGLWSPAGSLLLPRELHTATLLPSGKVLVAGGLDGNVPVASAEIYDPVTGIWSPAGSLRLARSHHTANLLQSGKVLVAGGLFAERSAEIYDPSTDSWELTGELSENRLRHTATLLASGRVLVAGGFGSGLFTKAEVELYDPVTGTWETAAPLLQGRAGHSATLLPSGEVLVAGGDHDEGPPLTSAELYDPGNDVWVSAGAFALPSRRHTATLLASGGVLLVGGEGIGANSTAELYFSSGKACQPTQLPSRDRHNSGAVLLPSGKVLFTGGGRPGAELYDEVTNTWEGAGSPAIARFRPITVLLPSGKVLLAGGDGETSGGSFLPTNSAELYDPETHTWEPTGSLHTARSHTTATRLANGRILVVGGFGNSDALASAELYDTETGLWEFTAPLATGRHSHTATLLASGKVLVAGGSDGRSRLASAEIYDPATGTWESTGELDRPRYGHTATLLPSGKVFVVGGEEPVSQSAEVYDPATGNWRTIEPPSNPHTLHTATLLPSGRVFVASLTNAETYDPSTGAWEAMPPLALPRRAHRAVVLPSGRVFLVGGFFASLDTPTLGAEICDPDPVSEERRPLITSAGPQIQYGVPFPITGRFRGDSEAGSGSTQNSAANVPILRLRSLDGAQQTSLTPDPRPNFWDDPMTLTVSDLPPTFHPGPHLLSAVVAGAPSEFRLVELLCSVAIIRHPENQRASLGATVTFSVESQGGRLYQWRKDGIDIPGATGASYTTPPVSSDDSGALYAVRVETGCTDQVSNPAVLTVADSVSPQVSVVSPSGGEYWILSSPDLPSREIVTWSMKDDIRICRVEVRLLFSGDGGQTYQPVLDPAGGVLLTAGPGGTCRFGEQPSVTSLSYDVPSAPPSGTPGSLYKIEIRVIDHAGLTTTARSANPFFIVQPNPDTVRTLILSNLQRMRTVQGLSQEQADALAVKLRELAGHPRVQGLVVDLAGVTSLTDLYQSWDADPSSPDRANAILFAPGGLHDYLRSELLPTYTGVKYLVLVGHDRTLPLARVPDRTGLRESAYVLGGDLTAAGTVGAALAADRYLSDDLLGARGSLDLPLTADQREQGAFLPELSVGRLVETPDEITTTIATFISQDGVLDLQALHPATGHKVLVTGYDFLIDAGRRIRARWKEALGLPLPHEDADLEPVDGFLLTPAWDEAAVADRRAALSEHLSGNGGARYGVVNLNGHATHYLEGVPGAGVTDIQGLSTTEIYGPNTCGGGVPLALAGSVIYAVGCHGGLPVAGSCAADPDRSLDLAQTFLARGVLAYVANTGYGWGLVDGVGYGERLVDILTEEITAGGTVAVGDAVRRAKLRYFLELPRFDDYDEKTLLQWTVFGLPMYAIRTGITTAATAADAEGSKRMEPIRVESRIEAAAALPPFLTQLNAHFDFTGPGVYKKHNAAGDPLPEGFSGCPAPEPSQRRGCYYTLNGLSGGGTGSSDLPIQPYFLYESRLSGTSQHGALWMGGTYAEEGNWVPVMAQLVSNGGDFSNHGSMPWMIHRPPKIRRRPTGEEPGTCRPNDLEASTLVMITGEVFGENQAGSLFSRQRIYREIDLEVFYFNDQGQGGNCDRTGPEFGSALFSGVYHQTSPGQIEWAVPASDQAGVWRVLVIYDVGPDAQGRGSWAPLELVNEGNGIWQGRLQTAGLSRLTYFLQAVDRRGNVSWLQYASASLPASGVLQELPLPVDVFFSGGSPLPFQDGFESGSTSGWSASGPVSTHSSSSSDTTPRELLSPDLPSSESPDRPHGRGQHSGEDPP